MAMGRIHLLDEVTANKIAAGEVVERPAAVVKELVENAIDAGATKLDISISGGGLECIRVADDGQGIAAEDVPLALQRHATSKISCAADLSTVMTMGFRGEALPSIAAVSRFRLVTRRPEDLVGTEAQVHGGNIIRISETGSPVGTEVRVDELFFNTPARLKFLKTVGAEAAKVTDTVQRLALAWPEVSFSFTSNGKLQLITAGNGKLADAAAQVLGRQNMQQMFPLAWQGQILSLHGFLAQPSLCRANRNLQYFFVNRRWVRSPLLSDALQTAYHTLLPRNRFPAAIVFVDLDPQEVDVNVHPAKREVRFSRERDLYRQFLAGAKDALRSAALVADVTASPTFDTKRSSFTDYVPTPVCETRTEYAEPLQFTPTEIPPRTEAKSEGIAAKAAFPYLRPIGQYRATYILAHSDTGELYIVDQHAAHERILYDNLKKDLSLGGLPVQEVLPQTFDLDPQTASTLLGSLDLFAQLGLTFEHFGNNTFILRTMPLFFRHCLNQDELTALLAIAHDTVTTASLFEKTLQIMACKAAVKANHPLEKSEMARLLDNLTGCEQPHTCPHGRPTVLVFSEQSLAKNFRRQ